jgi:hypothetical protein
MNHVHEMRRFYDLERSRVLAIGCACAHAYEPTRTRTTGAAPAATTDTPPVAAAAAEAASDNTPRRRMRRPLFAGNWKLNPVSGGAAEALAAVVAADYAALVADGVHAADAAGTGWSEVRSVNAHIVQRAYGFSRRASI